MDPRGFSPTLAGTIAGGVIGGPPGAVVGAFVGTGVGIIGGQLLWDNMIKPWFYNKPPKDAHDPCGAKAPGKPSEEEGFKDPKGGERWISNPNGPGGGWEADDGRVWVPTGPRPDRTHGGPHWDVQDPSGGHTNVYPGGRTR